MVELSWAERQISNAACNVIRAYRDPIYRISKAALEPVVAAMSDVIKESVTEAVTSGVKDALTPEFLGELIFGRARKRWPLNVL